ncbi:hypothetical protein EOL73_04085 [Candidatus Saccharibacteria bacterium]|nr:hypothetical protein [Candidatus Saccharibacteria bacterium]
MARTKKPIARNFDSPRTCGGKFCYRNRQEAEAVIKEKSILQPELELSIYRCLSCGSFHLTRTGQKKQSI